jgi:hypothetical protein
MQARRSVNTLQRNPEGGERSVVTLGKTVTVLVTVANALCWLSLLLQ